MEISATYRLVSYLLADNWLICRLGAQCMISNTVKPVLSGHRIMRTPSIKRTVAKSPNLFLLFTLNETFIKRTPLLSGRGHLKST